MKFVMLALFVFAVLLFTGQSTVVAKQSDRPFKILNKPHAKTNGECEGSGRVVLSVTFDKSGIVSNVEEAEVSGCRTFNQNAVKAARKIKFQSAIKNGEPVTVTKLMEYIYRVY